MRRVDPIVVQCSACNKWYDSNAYIECPYCNKAKKREISMETTNDEDDEALTSGHVVWGEESEKKTTPQLNGPSSTASSTDNRNVFWNGNAGEQENTNTGRKNEGNSNGSSAGADVLRTASNASANSVTVNGGNAGAGQEMYSGVSIEKPAASGEETRGIFRRKKPGNGAGAPIMATAPGNNNGVTSGTVLMRDDPVVGWMVCVKGANLGRAFEMYEGKNSVGRNPGVNDIVIPNEVTVSREKQCYVIYEPNKRQYFIKSGDTKSLTYLNGELIDGMQRIQSGDMITLGGCELRFVPLCSEDFSWEDYIDIEG